MEHADLALESLRQRIERLEAHRLSAEETGDELDADKRAEGKIGAYWDTECSPFCPSLGPRGCAGLDPFVSKAVGRFLVHIVTIMLLKGREDEAEEYLRRQLRAVLCNGADVHWMKQAAARNLEELPPQYNAIKPDIEKKVWNLL